jgi:uncharacterized RDD family membrane protein YckC
LTGAPLPRPAGLLRRIGAMIYDAMIVLAIWMLTLFAGVAIHNGAVVGPLVQSILFLEYFAFFAYFWVARGQTVGMLAWDLRLETDDGRPIRLAQALLRLLPGLLSFAIGLALIRFDSTHATLPGAAAAVISFVSGYLWMYVDPDRRTWPDMLSKSRVIHLPRA